MPTSLPAVSNDPVPVGQDGYYNGPTRCGFKTCFLIFSCPCGRKLGNTFCTGDDTCGGCTPPEICPQSLTLDEINERFAQARSAQEENQAYEEPQTLALSPAPEGGSMFGAQRFSDSMLGFRDDLANVENLYIRASVYIHLTKDAPTVGRGTFEYWAAGESYYVRAQADAHLGLGHGIEASFDGNEARLLLAESNLLIRDNGSPQPVTLPFPSPLQVPFYFLQSPDCPTCLGTLDALVDPTTWSSALEGAKAIKGGLLLRGPVVEVKGATYFSVEVHDSGAASRIEWKTFGDELLAKAEARDFRNTPMGVFPGSLTLTSFDESGRPMARIFYRINEIEANSDSYSSSFRVPEDRAEMIWENQERRFSKHFDAVDPDL